MKITLYMIFFILNSNYFNKMMSQLISIKNKFNKYNNNNNNYFKNHNNNNNNNNYNKNHNNNNYYKKKISLKINL